MTKLFATIAAAAMCAVSAFADPYTMLTVPDTTPLWMDNADPFAIAIATNAHTIATNAQGRIDGLVAAMVDTNAVTKQTTFTVNGRGGQLATNNAVVLTAADVGAPSVAELHALMSTGRVSRVWEGSNAWYEFSGSVITRRETSPTLRWVLDVPETLQANAVDDIYPRTNLVLDIAAELPDGDTGLPAWSTSTAFLSVNNFSAGKVSLVITVDGSADYVWEADLADPRTATHYDLVDYAESATVTLDWLQVGITTNTTAYSLIHPPETWSYADMTNWMEFGNAGQLWVTDLASDAANVIVNGHLAATDPHPGKYVKLTGGAATNLALVNASVGGDTVIGAVAVSNAVAAMTDARTTPAQVSNIVQSMSSGIAMSDVAIFSCTNFTSVMNLFRTTGAPNALRNFDYIANNGYGFTDASNSTAYIADIYCVAPPCAMAGYTALVSRITMYAFNALDGQRANVRTDCYSTNSTAYEQRTSNGLFSGGIARVFVTNFINQPVRLGYVSAAGDLSDTAPTRTWKNVEHAWVQP